MLAKQGATLQSNKHKHLLELGMYDFITKYSEAHKNILKNHSCDETRDQIKNQIVKEGSNETKQASLGRQI